MTTNRCAKWSAPLFTCLKRRTTLPDLIIIDGGKGHVDAVRDILENELGLRFL